MKNKIQVKSLDELPLGTLVCYGVGVKLNRHTGLKTPIRSIMGLVVRVQGKCVHIQRVNSSETVVLCETDLSLFNVRRFK